MRDFIPLAVGQIWRSADPRRQFTTFFTIIERGSDLIKVRYNTGKERLLARDAFRVVGPRGYVRES